MPRTRASTRRRRSSSCPSSSRAARPCSPDASASSNGCARRWARGARRPGRLRARLGAGRDRQDAARGRARGRGSSASGAAVLYAGGGEVADAALAAVAEAGIGHRPSLLVLDHADDAPPAVLEAAAALAREPDGRALLICVLHHDEQGPPAFAGLLKRRRRPAPAARPAPRASDGRDRGALRPRRGRSRCPLQTLIAESEGVPLRIHRAAGGWARAEAAERLAATTGRAAGDRSELHATQAAVAGGVVDLQTANERTRLYAVDEPPEPLGAPGLSLPRAGALRRGARRVLLRPRAPHRPNSSPASSARPCSPSSAPPAAASPRRCARGCCRRSPTVSSPAPSAGAGR